jgi:hypothetical protein
MTLVLQDLAGHVFATVVVFVCVGLNSMTAMSLTLLVVCEAHRSIQYPYFQLAVVIAYCLGTEYS